MTSNIAAALAKAQAEMGKAIKESTNPAFRSKYADLGNVMDACLPALNKHNIAVIQPIVSDVDGRFVKTILIHESGETLECAVPLIVGKNDMQGLGSAITYGRRYGLMSMAGIAPEDDDGNAAAEAPPIAQAVTPKQPTAVDVAIGSIATAESLDRLSAIWAGLPRSVQGESRVIDAKNAAKARLPPSAAKPLTDEIPY